MVSVILKRYSKSRNINFRELQLFSTLPQTNVEFIQAKGPVYSKENE